MGRLISRAIVFLVLVVVVVGGGGAAWLWSSLLSPPSKVALTGLTTNAEVWFDRHGVPHIKANNLSDAFRALGFVHAKDRLWQMEFQRRAGAGRLSEIMGDATVNADRFLRTMGFYRNAKSSFDKMDADSRAVLEAYADGVNDWMGQNTWALPPEFEMLRITPEPWTPTDSVVWGRLMAMDLGTNWRTELLRARLASKLTPAQIEDLWPEIPASEGVPAVHTPGHTPKANSPIPIQAANLDIPSALFDQLAAIIPYASADSRGASNNWVLSAARSASGKPLLANDPHLGFRAPILWYLAHIETPNETLSGVTVPGVPAVILGHNRHVAWGLTNTQADTEDLFVEKVSATDPGAYVIPGGGTEAFSIRTETIQVKGGEPVTMRIRQTRHGVVISDLAAFATPESLKGDGETHVLALSATMLRDDDLTAQALVKLNGAKSVADVVTALRDVHAPQQNVVFADTDGNIGYVAAGRTPIRKRGHGTYPRPGWTGEWDWDGFVPFDELPQTVNPGAGLVITANTKVVDNGYPHFIARDWSVPYRAQTIAGRLAQTEKHTMDTMADVQTDVMSAAAIDLLPLMLTARPKDTRGQRAMDLLRGWNGKMLRNLPEPLIFTTWLRELNRLIYADELGARLDNYWKLRPHFIRSVLRDKQGWCDDVGTKPVETCDMVLALSLDMALDHITAQHGDDISAWRWGAAHKARFDHPIMSKITPLLWSPKAETDGGDFTVNRGTSRIKDETAPFEQIHGPGLRALYDLADLSQSRFMIATGQSGNPLSAHFDDLLPMWANGEYLRIDLTVDELRAQGAQRIEFYPN